MRRRRPHLPARRGVTWHDGPLWICAAAANEAPSIVPRTDLDPRMLPVGLVVSLILSATCWLCIQCPLVSPLALA